MTGMTKPRSWFLIASWIALVAALVVCLTLISKAGGGSPSWVVSLIVSWLPFIALIGVWIWLSRRSWRGSSGASWVDLCEQQVVESQRTNALLERIAAALEKHSPG
ncbi:hypothetical protein [Bradyrhizobium tropiciagri]|uniref:hypothetical protein n=1 Tax=Bradyrhizobium tropiciagri TaxID=312253 RepID=UPI001FCE1E20|nr:hypothetical protein [Bradyrhizobium tropiciagri]